MKEHAIEGYAKANYIKMVVKLFYFYPGITVCLMPVMINFIYELSYQRYISPEFSAIGAFCTTLNPSLVNPILLFYLNFIIRCHFVQKYGFIYCTKGKIVNYFNKVHRKRYRIASITTSSSIELHYDMKKWMNDPHLWEKFTATVKRNMY